MGKRQEQQQQEKGHAHQGEKARDQQKTQRIEQQTNQVKKKIIKKFPFKTALNTKQDDLKDWKPVKIQRNKQQKDVNGKSKQENLAVSFLSSLSKPVNNKPQGQKRPIFFDDDQPVRLPPKPAINMSKLTPEQIKWDIEDQTFIKKKVVPSMNIEHNLEQNPGEQEEPLQNIVVKGKQKQYIQNNTSKMRHIDLTKVINKNWQQSAQIAMNKNQLWEGAQGLLDGHGSLSKLAKQAQQKAHQIQSEMNKRSYQRKQMKSRYGW